MVYRGGPVISNVKVYTVFWGSNVANQSQLDSFYGTLVNSPYVDWLSEYDTPTQNIGRGSFQSSYVDANAPTDSQVTDDGIQQELAQLIDQGALPTPDANTLFMVHFPAGIAITMQGAQSCQQFCAYHSSFSHGGGNVYYGVMPDFSGRCSSCGGESNQFDDTTVVASHEVAEAMTDPNIGVANATNDEMQLGWYDDTYSEIGDVCQGQSVTFMGYRVTKLWSNKASACMGPQTTSGGGGTGSSSSSSSSSGGSTSSSSSSSGSGSTSSSSSGGGGQCSHSVCRPGAPLSASCGSCTQTVCQYVPECCSQDWDPTCIEYAEYFCHRHCQ